MSGLPHSHKSRYRWIVALRPCPLSRAVFVFLVESLCWPKMSLNETQWHCPHVGATKTAAQGCLKHLYRINKEKMELVAYV